MSGYRLFSTSILPILNEVRLYDETIEHVWREHPEIPSEFLGIVDAVGTAVSNPTHVEQSHGNSVIFVDTMTTNRSGDPLRVPVKRVSGKSGRVRTFYFASPNTAGKIIWRRPI